MRSLSQQSTTPTPLSIALLTALVTTERCLINPIRVVEYFSLTNEHLSSCAPTVSRPHRSRFGVRATRSDVQQYVCILRVDDDHVVGILVLKLSHLRPEFVPQNAEQSAANGGLFDQ